MAVKTCRLCGYPLVRFINPERYLCPHPELDTAIKAMAQSHPSLGRTIGDPFCREGHEDE